MSQFDTADLQTDGSTDLDDRDARALEQYLTVLPEAPGMYSVTSQSGNSYTVDVRDGHCTCPDHEYRDVRCKHIRRVEYETGRRPLPDGVDRDGLPADFGRHVDGEPVRAVTDGGTDIDEDDDEACLCETSDGPGCFEHYQGGEA